MMTDSGKSTKVSVDNQGAIDLAPNYSINLQTKHIDLRFHFICAALRNSEINLKYLPTPKNDC